MISVCRADQLKRFAPFSLLNQSFIFSLNVKVCISFVVFLQISVFFLFVKSYVGWEICALASRLHVFVSIGGESKKKNFRTGEVTDLREVIFAGRVSTPLHAMCLDYMYMYVIKKHRDQWLFYCFFSSLQYFSQ